MVCSFASGAHLGVLMMKLDILTHLQLHTSAAYVRKYVGVDDVRAMTRVGISVLLRQVDILTYFSGGNSHVHFLCEMSQVHDSNLRLFETGLL